MAAAGPIPPLQWLNSESVKNEEERVSTSGNTNLWMDRIIKIPFYCLTVSSRYWTAAGLTAALADGNTKLGNTWHPTAAKLTKNLTLTQLRLENASLTHGI